MDDGGGLAEARSKAGGREMLEEWPAFLGFSHLELEKRRAPAHAPHCAMAAKPRKILSQPTMVFSNILHTFSLIHETRLVIQAASRGQ